METRIVVLLLLICMGILTGAAAEETGILQDAVTAGEVSVEMGDTVTVADTIEISLPMDWVRRKEEIPGMEGVGYTGTDQDGTTVMLVAVKDTIQYGSLRILQKRLIKTGTSYFATTYKGIDLLAVQGSLNGDEGTEMLVCVSYDGRPIMVLFRTMEGDARKSEKLRTDITAIVQSLKVRDGAKLSGFGDSFPGDTVMEAGLNADETGTAVIPYGEGDSIAVFELLPRVNGDVSGVIADGGKVNENVYWAVETDGTLHFIGFGPVEEFHSSNLVYGSDLPWLRYVDRITGIIVHEGITAVPKGIFSGYPNCRSIVIGSTITKIADLSAAGSGIEEVIVDPWNGQYASADGVLYNREMNELLYFPAKKDYDTFVLPSTVTTFGSFYGNGLTAIRIPDQIRQIGRECFAGCESLREIVFPDGLETIEDYVCDADTELQSVHIPVSVKKIGECAFPYCGNNLEVEYQGTRAQWNRMKIGGGNSALMMATVRFADGTSFSAMNGESFEWGSMTAETIDRIGKIERENIWKETIHQKYEVWIPMDWKETDGVYVGTDEEGNTARMLGEVTPIAEYKGNWSSKGYAKKISKTVNGISTTVVSSDFPFDEYVTITCWDSEYYYMICVVFDINLPLRKEKLVDDAAFIIGSLRMAE